MILWGEGVSTLLHAACASFALGRYNLVDSIPRTDFICKLYGSQVYTWTWVVPFSARFSICGTCAAFSSEFHSQAPVAASAATDTWVSSTPCDPVNWPSRHLISLSLTHGLNDTWNQGDTSCIFKSDRRVVTRACFPAGALVCDTRLSRKITGTYFGWNLWNT